MEGGATLVFTLSRTGRILNAGIVQKKSTIKELKKELRLLVSEIAEADLDKVTDDARFVKDLGMDSMMALKILTAIEEKYRIQIPENVLPKLTSLKEDAYVPF